MVQSPAIDREGHERRKEIARNKPQVLRTQRKHVEFSGKPYDMHMTSLSKFFHHVALRGKTRKAFARELFTTILTLMGEAVTDKQQLLYCGVGSMNWRHLWVSMIPTSLLSS
jgi:hypothetical protein